MSTEEGSGILDELKLDERQALAILPSMASLARGEGVPVDDLRNDLRRTLDISDHRVTVILNSLTSLGLSTQSEGLVHFTDSGRGAWKLMQLPENRDVDLPSSITDSSIRSRALELRNLEGDFSDKEPSKAELGKARETLVNSIMEWDGVKDSVIAEHLLGNLDSILNLSSAATPVVHLATNEGSAIFIKADEDRIFGFPEKLDYINSRNNRSEHAPIILRAGDGDGERIKKMTSLLRKNRNSLS